MLSQVLIISNLTIYIINNSRINSLNLLELMTQLKINAIFYIVFSRILPIVLYIFGLIR